MPDRRGSRFVVEALFLVVLAVALAFAHLDAIEIVGAMAVGWVVVAALEWAAWRGEPHYGSGLPPRYYVPGVNLPPPQPLEQVEQGYPGGSREEAPTWIASAALRAEVLGEWPVAAPVELEDEAAEEEEPEFVPATEPDADPWTIAELPAEPEEPEQEAEAEPAPEPVLAPPQRLVPLPNGTRTARYSIDPLGDPPAKRRFGRRGGEAPATIEVPARPAARALPDA